MLHQPSKVYRDSATYKARQLPLTTMSIEEIVEKTGVSKKAAYTLKREAVSAASPDVPQNQRQRMLVVLHRHPKEARNTRALMTVMRQSGANGYEIDEHDTNKVLWSLQKTGHVRFRERQGSGAHALFGIKLTDRGHEAATSIIRYATGGDPLVNAVADQILNDADRRTAQKAPVEPLHETGPDVQLPDEEEEPVKWEPPTEEMHAPVMVPDVIKDSQDPDDPESVAFGSIGTEYDVAVDPIQRPWFKGNLGGWPAFRELRDRARKTAKLTAAAKLLEEAGEDDIALDLMTRTTFTPLEEEVIALLEAFEELP